MASRKLHELSLRKEILRLKADTYRLEIEQALGRLRQPASRLETGARIAGLLRRNPAIVSAATALAARVHWGRAFKWALVGVAAWQGFRFVMAVRANVPKGGQAPPQTAPAAPAPTAPDPSRADPHGA